MKKALLFLVLCVFFAPLMVMGMKKNPQKKRKIDEVQEDICKTPVKQMSKKLEFTSPEKIVIPLHKCCKTIFKDLNEGNLKAVAKEFDLFLKGIPYDSTTQNPRVFWNAIFYNIFSLLGKNDKFVTVKSKSKPILVVRGFNAPNNTKKFLVFSYGDHVINLGKFKKHGLKKDTVVVADDETLCISFDPDASSTNKFSFTRYLASPINDCFFSGIDLSDVAPYDHQNPYHDLLNEMEKSSDDFKSAVCESLLKNIYAPLIERNLTIEYESFFQLVLVAMLSFLYDDITWEQKCLDGRSDCVFLPNDKRKEVIIVEFKFRGWKIKENATNVVEEALEQIETKYAKRYSVHNVPVYMIAIVVVRNEETGNFSVTVSPKKEYDPQKVSTTIKTEDTLIF